MDPVVLKEIHRDNISTSQMMSLASVYQEFGLPTFSELILGLPGDSYERHINSISQVLEAGINVVEVYTCMLLNGTQLNTAFSRATHNIGSHFRILPRDFAKLGNGRIAVEIEEVVSSTNTMSFQDYQNARKMHLMVAVVYNGGGFNALLRLMRQNKVPIVQLLQRMVADMDTAPPPVKAVFDSFVRLTRDELWDSEEELRKFIYTGENYKKLLNGEIGINLIQTHTAMSLAVMDHWVDYVFRIAGMVLAGLTQEEKALPEILNELRAYCLGRVHNIWGSDRNESNPCISMNYDVSNWLHSPLSTPISEYKFNQPVMYKFAFSDTKKEEMAAQIKRYGATATGIGRIMAQMGRDRIWREPERMSSALIES